jgi:hypothetical protein
MTFSRRQALRKRYQGPEHRSRASQCQPDTSGLLSCQQQPYTPGAADRYWLSLEGAPVAGFGAS